MAQWVVLRTPTKADNGQTILIVEDNEHLQRILGSIVEFFGYRTLAASTGAQATDIAITAKPNLVLLDLDLPDLPGKAVARKITGNRLSSHIPIIACSAFSSDVKREQALHAGMVDYLQKPITAKTLQAQIAKFIIK